MTPVTILMTLAPGEVTAFQRTQVHTKGAEVHEAGENDNPGVHGIDYVATIELGEPELDTVHAAQNKELTGRPSANQ